MTTNNESSDKQETARKLREWVAYWSDDEGKLECPAGIDPVTLVERAADLLSLPSAALPRIPEGWTLVPIEPTDEMLRAIENGGEPIGKEFDRLAWARGDWAHTLKHVPPPPVAVSPEPSAAPRDNRPPEANQRDADGPAGAAPSNVAPRKREDVFFDGNGEPTNVAGQRPLTPSSVAPLGNGEFDWTEAPRVRAIFDAYYEKEGRSAEDEERDLWIPFRQLERELAEAQPVMDMLMLDGNVGPELLGVAKLRAIIDALIEARSATGASKEFAARVRPAVAAWVNKCDRSALNPTFPKHYGPLLRSEADKAHALLEEIDTMIGDAPECSHYWIPNSGKGGEPEFRLNSQMGTEPVMHVMCSLCDTRTWFTEKQWWAIPATVEPRRLDSTGAKG